MFQSKVKNLKGLSIFNIHGKSNVAAGSSDIFTLWQSKGLATNQYCTILGGLKLYDTKNEPLTAVPCRFLSGTQITQITPSAGFTEHQQIVLDTNIPHWLTACHCGMSTRNASCAQQHVHWNVKWLSVFFTENRQIWAQRCINRKWVGMSKSLKSFWHTISYDWSHESVRSWDRGHGGATNYCKLQK